MLLIPDETFGGKFEFHWDGILFFSQLMRSGASGFHAMRMCVVGLQQLMRSGSRAPRPLRMCVVGLRPAEGKKQNALKKDQIL